MKLELKYAYIAGLIDGEGTITLYKSGKESKFRYPIISMSSTSMELLEFVKNTLGGHIISKKSYESYHKESWEWRIKGCSAISSLGKITPYMVEYKKVARAKHIIEKYNEVTMRNGKYTDEQLMLKMNFQSDFFDL